MIGSAGAASAGGWSMKPRVCGPPSPPWKEISSSNAQPSSSVGVVEAADHHVGDVGEAVGALEVLRGGGGERGERVVALDPVLVEVAGAAGAEHDRAVLLGAHQHPADVRMAAQRGQQLGWRASSSSIVSRRFSSIR